MSAGTLSSHNYDTWADRLAASKARARVVLPWPVALPGDGERPYVNRETGRRYSPHNDDEADALVSDGPTRLLVKGGEGSGKSVFGVIKTLERLRRGMRGIMGSPDLPHLRNSLWPEFRRWCPWDQVVPSQADRLASLEWEPHGSFTITFRNGAQLMVGGFDDPEKWEGPNVHFAHVDEARRKREPKVLTVLDGRIRLAGPNGEPPQLWFTTTPRKHWLFVYFGGAPGDESTPPRRAGDPDPFADFKADARVITLRTEENRYNLDPEYYRKRQASLTELERRVLMDAEWLDLDDVDRFLPDMMLWDSLAEELPPLSRTTPIVLAADAGVSNDSFGLVGVSIHPRDATRLAVRVVREWKPRPGSPLDFDDIEEEIKDLCKTKIRAIHLGYDPYQLHQMATSLKRAGIVPTSPFNQQGDRLIADKGLLDAILAGELAHDGNALLREHISNADKLLDEDRKRIRIVKREPSLKIDLAVALSMARARQLDPKALGITGKTIGVPLGALTGAVARNIIAGTTR